MSAPQLLPHSTEGDNSHTTPDFVLFDDSSIYAANYRHPMFAHSGGSLFQSRLSALSDSTQYPEVLGDQLADDLQAADSMSKQYYSLGVSTSADLNALPMASEAPPYNGQSSVYSPYNNSDIPRTNMGVSYMDESAMTSTAPGVLIHPPTLPYHPQGHIYTPSASPSSTSVGAFEGSGSCISGSEAGSVHNSPYARPLENIHQLFDPTFVVDPSLISNSPSEQRPDPISAGSPFGSPTWNTSAMHSPPTITSNPASPNLHRHASGRLSPSYRVQPYRRPSTGSVHSWRSNGSPTLGNVEYNEQDFYSDHTLAHMPVHSPSQRSVGSTHGPRTGSSTESIGTMASGNGGHSGKDGKETLCPECNKCFRDLRAHQLTHQLTRPEKCPIATCEYSKKGFARKYDCQRHTLTHYKGTMVCGFCPGSGSAMEKSFNRADVFKRHLMAVHNVEQTPPNGRQKKSNNNSTSRHPKSANTPQDTFTGASFATGKCSTCSITFQTAQQFYEHLDDCVLSKVVEDEPCAASNARNLDSVHLDTDNNNNPENHPSDTEDEEEDEDDDDLPIDNNDDDKDDTYAARKTKPRGRKNQR